MRELPTTFVKALLSAQGDAVCGRGDSLEVLGPLDEGPPTPRRTDVAASSPTASPSPASSSPPIAERHDTAVEQHRYLRLELPNDAEPPSPQALDHKKQPSAPVSAVS